MSCKSKRLWYAYPVSWNWQSDKNTQTDKLKVLGKNTRLLVADRFRMYASSIDPIEYYKYTIGKSNSQDIFVFFTDL